MELVLTIPDEVRAEAQHGQNGAGVRRLLEHIGVELYKADAITRPQLEELLGIDRFELDGVLKAHGVFFDYSPEELAEEAETIRWLFEARAVEEWANQPRSSAPPLSDEAISRVSIYGEREDKQL